VNPSLVPIEKVFVKRLDVLTVKQFMLETILLEKMLAVVMLLTEPVVTKTLLTDTELETIALPFVTRVDWTRTREVLVV
jgi:hypothetical protein